MLRKEKYEYDKIISTIYIDDEEVWTEEVTDFFNINTDLIRMLATSNQPLETKALIQKYNPDVVLLDYSMPGLNGFEVAQNIRFYSNVPILMLSAKIGEIENFKELGISGFISKSEIFTDLNKAVESVYSGHAYYSRYYSILVQRSIQKRQNKLHELWISLTKTEKAICFQLVEGSCPNSAAERLSIGIPTVRWHIKNIRTKLFCKDIYGLLKFLHELQDYR